MAFSESVLNSRLDGFKLLRGKGIEIGAFHEPAPLPADAQVTYADVFTRAQAIELFPEVDPTRMVDPTLIIDLDRTGLGSIESDTLDFVIACHVLEHLANPLFAIAEIFRVLRDGGRAVIAIPDKRFTFDQPRALTSFIHLWRDYLGRVTESPDDHYFDFLCATTCIAGLPPSQRIEHIQGARRRREHSHVWDSESFRETLLITLPLVGRRARLIYESPGDANQFEYFSVWEKSPAFSSGRSIPGA
jgi:SAM-dependent methyltransferase